MNCLKTQVNKLHSLKKEIFIVSLDWDATLSTGSLSVIQCNLPFETFETSNELQGRCLFFIFVTVITRPAARYDKAWLSDRELLISGELGGFVLYLSPCKSMILSCETQQAHNKEKLLNKRHSLCSISPGPQQTSSGTTALRVCFAFQM